MDLARTRTARTAARPRTATPARPSPTSCRPSQRARCRRTSCASQRAARRTRRRRSCPRSARSSLTRRRPLRQARRRPVRCRLRATHRLDVPDSLVAASHRFDFQHRPYLVAVPLSASAPLAASPSSPSVHRNLSSSSPTSLLATYTRLLPPRTLRLSPFAPRFPPFSSSSPFPSRPPPRLSSRLPPDSAHASRLVASAFRLLHSLVPIFPGVYLANLAASLCAGYTRGCNVDWSVRTRRCPRRTTVPGSLARSSLPPPSAALRLVRCS